MSSEYVFYDGDSLHAPLMDLADDLLEAQQELVTAPYVVDHTRIGVIYPATGGRTPGTARRLYFKSGVLLRDNYLNPTYMTEIKLIPAQPTYDVEALETMLLGLYGAIRAEVAATELRHMEDIGIRFLGGSCNPKRRILNDFYAQRYSPPTIMLRERIAAAYATRSVVPEGGVVWDFGQNYAAEVATRATHGIYLYPDAEIAANAEKFRHTVPVSTIPRDKADRLATEDHRGRPKRRVSDIRTLIHSIEDDFPLASDLTRVP